METQKLSFGDELSDDRRKTEFGVVTIHAHTIPEAVISMVVPAGWKEIHGVPPPGNRPGWQTLASYAKSDNASLHLFQVSESYEVNLKDWLVYQAFLLSITLGAEQQGQTEWGQIVHALGTSSEGDRMRFVVAGDGPNLFFLMGRAGKSDALDTDAILGLSAGSFLFRKHSHRATIESLKEYQDPHKLFQVRYPESWSVEPRTKETAGRRVVDFRITGEGDTVAYVRLTADVRPSDKPAELKSVYETTVQELAEAGIKLEELEAIPPGAGGGERERWLGSCQTPSGRSQLALLFRRGKFGWLTAVMLAPDKARNPIAWMRAKRFYEIVTATLKAT